MKKNIPKVERIPYNDGSKKRVDSLWLQTQRDFLRWKKTEDFAVWLKKQFLWQGGTCYYCDEPLNGTTQNVEHVVPKSKGGGNHPKNLVLACWRCNKSKYSKVLPQNKLESLRSKNRKKRGTYTKLKQTYKSETQLAYELRDMFRNG